MSNILFKMDQVTERVRALSFHPKRPWILVSVRSGDIQLWDYRMGVKIDTFIEHKCPVRAVGFHPTQPLFVSGGDDQRVIVWNFQQRKPLFTLYGHFDYIRSVEFHNEAPWILSASDDQTVRIWNWQSRTCIATLSGHGNYVHSAHFHPTESLVISGSADSTVRIWDISSLRAKTPSAASAAGASGLSLGLTDGDEDEVKVVHVVDQLAPPVNSVAFFPPQAAAGAASVMGFASAHGNDIHIWNFDEIRVWNSHTYSGHTQPVTSVLFHPHENSLLSASEDGTVRIWDRVTGGCSQISREKSFYTCLSAHPYSNLLAAGHSSGFQVFKLHRDRPAYCVDVAIPPAALASGAAATAIAAAASGSPNAVAAIRALGGAHMLYYVTKEMRIFQVNLRTHELRPLVSMSKASGMPRTLQYTTAKGGGSLHFLVLHGDSTYELVSVSGDGQQPSTSAASYACGFARSAVFVSSTRFAVLDKSRAVVIRSLKNEVKHKVTIPNAQALFSAGLGRIFIRTSDSMVLFDAHAYRVISKLNTMTRTPIKYVIASPDSKYFAFLSRNQVTIVSAKLELLATVMEPTRVKSAAWDVAGVLVYNTVTHAKYLLPNGDQGVIRTLADVVYFTHVSGNEVGFLDRRQGYGLLKLNSTEYLFKLALWKHRSKDVKRIMQTQALGMSIVSFLQKKGYPDIALHFAKDPKLKFFLALEHGDIAVATQFALEVNEPDLWSKLATEAMRQGRHDVAEAAAVRVQDFHRLLFLYMTTGQREKIGQLLEIAKHRGDAEGRFEASILLGDIRERVQVLRDTGHKKLAFVAATAHGLAEDAQALADEIGTDQLPSINGVIEFFSDSLTPEGTPDWRILIPRLPLLTASMSHDQQQSATGSTDGSAATSWPLLPVSRGFNFNREGIAEDEAADAAAAAEFEANFLAVAKETADDEMLMWGTDSTRTSDAAAKLGLNKPAGSPTAAESKSGVGSEGMGWDMDLNLGDLEADMDLKSGEDTLMDTGSADPTGFVMPSAGKSVRANWTSRNLVIGELFAAGEFDQAMHLLHTQIGATAFDVFKPYVLASNRHVEGRIRTESGLPMGYLPLPIMRPGLSRPQLRFNLTAARQLKATMSAAMTQADLASVRRASEALLAQIPLISLQGEFEGTLSGSKLAAALAESEAELLNLVKVAKEYLLLVILDTARNQTQDTVRKAELSAYCTHLELEPLHEVIALWLGCKYAYGAQAYRVVASFCRRLLTLSASTNLDALAGKVKIEQVRLMLRKCDGLAEQPGQPELKYNPSVAFAVCASTLQQISGARAAEGREVLVCGYCGAKHAESVCAGKQCSVCGISKLGLAASGLRLVSEVGTR